MRKYWTAFRQVFERELAGIIRDKDILIIILLSPLFYGFFYGTVYLNKAEAEIPILVVDRDHSATSRLLIRSLDAHQMLQVRGVVTDPGEARKELESWRVQGVFYIPADFQNQLKHKKGAVVQTWLNASKFLVANDLNKAISHVTATLGAGIKWRYLKGEGIHPRQAMARLEPLNGDIRSFFNPAETYGDFILPGILILIIQQTLLIGLAESVAKERESDTVTEWYNSGNRNILVVIWGKMGFYLLLYASYAALFFTLHFQLFKIPFAGSAIAAAFLTLLYLLALGLAIVFIGSFFKKKIEAFLMLVFTSYPLFLLSGFSWPLRSMPFYLRGLSGLLPGTPYLLAMDRVSLMGAGVGEVLPEVAHLLGLALFWGLLAAWRVKRMAGETLR
ncbi:MAG: ABC transporter permease [Calditrichia bacterium]